MARRCGQTSAMYKRPANRRRHPLALRNSIRRSHPLTKPAAGILARQGGIDSDPKLLRVNSVARNEFMLNEVAITQIGQRLENQSAIVLSTRVPPAVSR